MEELNDEIKQAREIAKEDLIKRNTPMELTEKIINKFDVFIEKWCGTNFPHLIDTDDNDGEEFRERLRAIFEKHRTIVAEKDKEISKYMKDVGLQYDKFNDEIASLKKEIEELNKYISSIFTSLISQLNNQGFEAELDTQSRTLKIIGKPFETIDKLKSRIYELEQKLSESVPKEKLKVIAGRVFGCIELTCDDCYEGGSGCLLEKAVDMLKELLGDDEEISLCKKCNVMTKTIDGKCGKCKEIKMGMKYEYSEEDLKLMFGRRKE